MYYDMHLYTGGGLACASHNRLNVVAMACLNVMLWALFANDGAFIFTGSSND